MKKKQIALLLAALMCITPVAESVAVMEAENNKNEKICYGYMEHKPKDYWISVNGEKISLN